MLMCKEVTSLATSKILEERGWGKIPYAHGVSALEKFLFRCCSASLPSTFSSYYLLFIHIHNYFSFNSLHYLQVNGTNMGTRMVSFYAYLFIESLEEDFLNSEDFFSSPPPPPLVLPRAKCPYFLVLSMSLY